MNMNFIKCIILLISFVHSSRSIPLKPFLYDDNISPSQYIVKIDPAFFTVSKEIMNNDILNNDDDDKDDILNNDDDKDDKLKSDIFWKDMNDSLQNYAALLKEIKLDESISIDWDKMNKEIMDELCEEMKGDIDEYFCRRNTMTFELEVFNDLKDPLVIDELINKINTENSPYTASNINHR